MKNIAIYSILFLLFFLGVSCSSFDRGSMNAGTFIEKSLRVNNLEQNSKAIDLIVADHPLDAVPLIAKALIENKTPDAGTRYYQALRLYDSKKILPYWVKILNETPHYKVKSEVIKYLRKTESRKLVLPMTRALSTPNSDVRKNAAIFLKKNGDDRMYPYILNLLLSKDPLRRIYSLEALNYVYDKRFTQLVINQLKDENKSIRIYALNCIQMNSLSSGIYQIRNAAQSDKNAEVRARALRVLAGLKDSRSQYVFIRMLNDSEDMVRLEALKAIRILRLRGAAYYLSQLLKKETNNEITEYAIATLSSLKTLGHYSGISWILGKSKSASLRIQAAKISSDITDRRLVFGLKKALKDKDYRVRAESAYGLRYYPYDNSISELIEVIKSDKNRYVRITALGSLKFLKKKSSVMKLFILIDDEKDFIFRLLLKETVAYLIKELI